jgi:Rps23 Pro-64 3,4-dihydroxylase Tpa1-like proline 4-hydroxylase|tara:strand:- start:18 stop:524 length:507 start_codon:yes stop_codon:yes gene_type:complete
MIKVFDDFLKPSEHDFIYEFALNSHYKIGWNDTNNPEHKRYPNIYSSYSKEDVEKINILDPVNKILKNKHKNKTTACIVNLTKPLDINFMHTHKDAMVALYYINTKWDKDWGGETIFYDKDGKSVLFTGPYTPNRLIYFDGSVPHTIKSQNILGPTYRFTLSLFFNKK